MAALSQISEARVAGREIIVHIDTTKLLVATCPLSTREIGKEWLALLRGEESELSDAVVRVRSRAPARRRIPGWQATRVRIFDRDGWACTYCGAPDDLECDHVVPFAKGGSSDDNNLTTACRSCNRDKRDRSVSEWRS